MICSNSCVIASGKGGTGKSSLASALGVVMARSGRRACIVDMDMGQRSADIMLGLENNVIFDMSDAAMGICRLKQALVSPYGMENLSLLAASQVKDASTLDPGECLRVVNKLCIDNDFVLIDTPPGLGEGFRLACRMTKKAVMIVTPDAVSLRDAQRAMDVMRECGIDDFKLVINRVKPWQTAIDYDLTPDAAGEWLGVEPLAVIHESDKPNPLIGNEAVARIARALTDDESIAWPAVKPGLSRRILDFISKIGKRSKNAKDATTV
ncbi:MAG: P-loop NTPase [Clostridia bacterium]|nr:P-loop NTPase [Clostridia bacterium]